MCTAPTLNFPLDKLHDSFFVHIPSTEQRVVPQSREHLNECRLPHSRLSFNNYRDSPLGTLVNVEHLEGKVECKNVTTVVNDRETTLLIKRNVQSSREEGVETTTRVQVTEGKEMTRLSMYIAHSIPYYYSVLRVN